MKKPPAVATAILVRLGPGDESIAGDLLEEYAGGRSRGWFWRQVLSAVALNAARDVANHPLRAIGSIATGWIVLLLLFALFGDSVANGLAKAVWNWDRGIGYGSQIWWPFVICAVLVSYSGFAMSAYVVGRMSRSAPGVLLAYVTSVVAVLVVSAIVIEIATQRAGGIAVPHPLFYIVSVTLPYHWRSGFLLVPLTMLLCGIVSGRRVART